MKPDPETSTAGTPRTPRVVLVLAGLLLGLAAAGAGYSAWVLTRPQPTGAGADALASLGADFALINQDGTTSRLSDLRGKVVLLFFGYTHCPDICPSALFTMAQARKLLGEDADRLQGVFITVDPQRDTPERLGEYVHYFDDDFLALTGPVSQLREVARSFGAHFEKEDVQADGSYLMAHTTFGYLIDADGKVAKLFQAGTTPEAMADAARSLIAGRS